MALHTIKITNCVPNHDPAGLHVQVCDLVRFCSADPKAYEVGKLDKFLRDAPDPLVVATGKCSGYYIVDGKKDAYKYDITGDPACTKPHGTPEIIIDN